MLDAPSDQPPKPAAERPAWHHLHLWQIQVVRDGLVILAAWGLLHLGYVLSSVTVPLLIALGLAYLCEPLICWLGQRHPRMTRPRAVMGILGGLVTGIVLLALILVPMVVAQVGGLVRNSGVYLERLETWGRSGKAPALIAREIPDLVAGVRTLIPGGVPAEAVTVTVPTVRPEAGNSEVAGRLLGLVGEAITIGFGAFLVAFFFAVFATTWPQVLDFLTRLIPPARHDLVVRLVGQMDLAVSGFVRGRLLISAILGAVFTIGWTICGVPHAVLLGLVVGLFTLVPYLSGVGVPLAWLMLLTSLVEPGASGFYIDEAASGSIIWWRVLLFPALVYGLGQLLEDWVLTPLIQGRATSLGPAAIVVAVLAGGALAGLYGMLLAIPVAACLKILVREVLWPRFQAWVRGERPDPLPLDHHQAGR